MDTLDGTIGIHFPPSILDYMAHHRPQHIKDPLQGYVPKGHLGNTETRTRNRHMESKYTNQYARFVVFDVY